MPLFDDTQVGTHVSPPINTPLYPPQPKQQNTIPYATISFILSWMNLLLYLIIKSLELENIT